MGLIVSSINKIISLLGSGISALLSILPDTPFSWDLSSVNSSYMAFFYWIVPIQGMITILTSFVTGVGLYYAIRTVLRWIKVAGQ